MSSEERQAEENLRAALQQEIGRPIQEEKRELAPIYHSHINRTTQQPLARIAKHPQPSKVAPKGAFARRLKELQPKPPPRIECPPLTPPRAGASFLDLPAELRLAIYQLILKDVRVHILPLKSIDRCSPHALLQTSHQIRSEVQPLIHENCEIRASVTDFDFSGLLAWLDRIPPECHKHLHKNTGLEIHLCMTPEVHSDLPSLRKWLHDRADPCRWQGTWKYSGPTPKPLLKSELKRRVRRMKEKRKQGELRKMVEAIGVPIYDDEL